MYQSFCLEKNVSIDIVTKYDLSTNGFNQLKQFGSNFSMANKQFSESMKNRKAFEQIDSGRTIETNENNKKINQQFCYKIDSYKLKENLIKTLNISF